MPQQQIAEELIQYVRSHFDIPADDAQFTPDVHLYDYGYVDSFGAEELTQHVETAYGVEIDEQAQMTQRLDTINQLAAFVAARQAA